MHHKPLGGRRMTLELGILVSGRGSNLQAILDATSRGELDARVRLVISNRPEAPALERARRCGVPTRVVDHRVWVDRASFDRELARRFREAGVEWLVLAGFTRIVTRGLLDSFSDRVVNIHPSLLPAFPGLDAQGQAIDHGARVTGCTVHLVTEAVDQGPILAQEALGVHPDDTRDSLAARLLELEHALLLATLRRLAAGDLTLDGPMPPSDRVRVRWRHGPPRSGFRET